MTGIEEHTAIRMLWRRDRAELVNVARPKNLLGALWLQFALTIERGSDFRRCAECGTWFELAPGLGRSDKQFCSVRCRVRSHRKRQAEGSAQPTHDVSAERRSESSKEPDRSKSRSSRSREVRPGSMVLASALNGLSGDERIAEIGEILALGLMRLRARQSSEVLRTSGESSLDFAAHQSGHDNRLKSEEALR
jgi:hypothetical protein